MISIASVTILIKCTRCQHGPMPLQDRKPDENRAIGLCIKFVGLMLSYYLLRELAFQISEQFEALGSSIGVKCGMLVKKLNNDMYVILLPLYNIQVLIIHMAILLAVIVGGMDMMSQSLTLARKPHIIIGT